MPIPTQVEVIEVGMRDGFQMESRFVPTEKKIRLGEQLIIAGVKEIEVSSFVSKTQIPQLSDAEAVVRGLKGKGTRLRALVATPRGAERGITAGIDALVIFISASETHNFKNVHRSIADSMRSAAELAGIAASANTALQGAIATAFGCPFEGDVGIERPMRVAHFFADIGITKITLGDTTGMATPPAVSELCNALNSELPDLNVSLHFHNTRGIAMANVITGLQAGVSSYEASFAGLGGCPFAEGATGNICTEDLIYLLDELHIHTGVDLVQMIDVAREVEAFFGRELPGQVMKAGPRLNLRSS